MAGADFFQGPVLQNFLRP